MATIGSSIPQPLPLNSTIIQSLSKLLKQVAETQQKIEILTDIKMYSWLFAEQ